jgi:hypothetical protein
MAKSNSHSRFKLLLSMICSENRLHFALTRSFGSGSCSNATKACVAEKTPLTNHIGGQFAWIKAPGFRLFTDYFGKKRDFTMLQQRARSEQRPEPLGDIRPEGRGDHAADHAAADFGVAARAARGLGFDHPPSGAIGQQGRQHGVIELVAPAHRAISAK